MLQSEGFDLWLQDPNAGSRRRGGFGGSAVGFQSPLSIGVFAMKLVLKPPVPSGVFKLSCGSAGKLTQPMHPTKPEI